ncbi:unnamed protein product [Callosobruchus maculatus]|uniref:Uncharacterized protein n=1 Tax=Callosobruchus maculatus TaxID=64391 RepID=A0A653D7T1_CALMS|nr:unnamed protein product [Callosobruchus maculatus]
MFDENSSSSSSGEVGSTAMIVHQNYRSHQHHMDDSSRNDDTMETVDSLQLHVNYKDEQTDETSSTATTATDKLSEQEEEEEEEEQEETLAATPDISNMAEMDSDPLKLNDNDREEGIEEGSDEEEEEDGERDRENEFEETVATYESTQEGEVRCSGEVDRVAEEEVEYSVEDTEEIEEGEDEEITGEEETELQGIKKLDERGSKGICDTRQHEDAIKEEKTLQSDISISSDATTTIDEPEDEHNNSQHDRNHAAGEQPLESYEAVRSDQATFQILPDDPATLMLQQGTLTRLLDEDDRVRGSGSNGDAGDGIVAAADIAETLEASVEECDLVIARLTTCADFVRDPSMPNQDVPAVDEDDRFLDAETYVLEESRQISTVDAKEETDANTTGNDIRATIFGEPVRDCPSNQPVSDECCWGMVDSTTEKLLETVVTAAVTVSREQVQSDEQCEQQDVQAEKEKPTSGVTEEEQVRVIPMREELEVRLEEATFPVVLSDWSSYASAVTSGAMHMNSSMVAAALATPNEGDCGEAESEPHSLSCESFLVEDKEREHGRAALSEDAFPVIDHQQRVKLELEVTLTPEIVTSDSMITSTVGSGHGTEPTVTSAGPKTLTTVIPPTTIVCLPSAVTTAPLLHNNNVAMAALINDTQGARLGSASRLQSSSAVPYLALTPGQAIRGGAAGAVKARPKGTGGTGGSSSGGSTRSGRSSASNKPPPGAVNLERSYQICQAVIQNSPNRDQLRCQLKPPPSLLAAAQIAEQCTRLV